MIKPIILFIAILATAGVFIFLLSKSARASSQINSIQSPEEKIKVPVNHNDYERFILVKGGSIHDIKKLLIEFGELNISNEHEVKKVNISKLGDLFLIKVDDGMSFYEYHNASHWLVGFGYESFNGMINDVFTLAFHQQNNDKTYYSYIDTDQTLDDTQIGAFENGKPLSIYLPGAYEENGNIVLDPSVLPKFNLPAELLEHLNLELTDLTDSIGENFEFKLFY
ncbi:MAG: hypothetical protein COA38_08355 [Fluviicola sp.]|nr:MAG: hypothetical protein COA38_08355 [Fluviicola sp.]